MTKVLVISDVHIDDFSFEGPGKFLSEYTKVAEIIRDKAIEIKAPFIILAGDTLNRPVSPPHVIAKLYEFLSILMESKARIVWISGQHDQNVKELENINDTYLSVFKSIFYGHEKSITIDGCKFYFENYTRNQEVDPLQESDVYISHVTLGRQTVNNKKFKLGVFGDIHTEMDIENMHSITPPRPFRAFENDKGVIGIITCDKDNPTFERFYYDPEYKIFPKLELKKKVIKKDVLDEKDREALDILSNTHDFYKDIESVVSEMGLSEVHRQVDLTGAPEPISLDFKINKIYIQDFKSIKKEEFDTSDLGQVIFLSGKNGSGKTSLIEALFVALLGDRHIKEYQSVWKGSDLKVGVSLTYKDNEYEIFRGPGWTSFKANGSEVQKANKSKLEEYIVECLPFLKILWYFYIKTYEHFFDKDRIGLVKQCFNLDIFDHFFNQGKLILGYKRTQYGKSLDETNQLKGKFDQENQTLATIKRDLETFSGVDESKESEINSELEHLRQMLVKRSTKKNEVESLKTNIKSLEEKVSQYSVEDREVIERKIEACKEIDKLNFDNRTLQRSLEQIENLINNLKMITCPNCGTTFQYGGTAKEDLENQKKELEKTIQDNKNRTKELLTISGSTSVKILEDTLQQVNKVEIYKGQIEKYKNDLDMAYSDLRDLDFELSMLPQQSDLQEKLINIGKKKIIIQNKLRSEQNLQIILSRAKEVKSQRLELQSQIADCERYVALFDMKNLDSLPYRLLVKVSEYLSTEDIQFKTYSEMANGNLKLDISCKMKVGDNFIDYDSCSHGQKTMLDLYILSRFVELLGQVGVICIDEGLSVLSSEKYTEACDTIRDFKSYNIFITSHDQNFVDYDSIIQCSLDSSGVTHVEVLN